MSTKLKIVLQERYLNEKSKKNDEEPVEYTTEEKKQFVDALSSLSTYGEVVYTDRDLKVVVNALKTISEMAMNMLKKTSDSEDEWFDNITISRNIKTLKEDIKIFERTAKEVTELQHRLANSYEEIAQILSKYFDVK